MILFKSVVVLVATLIVPRSPVLAPGVDGVSLTVMFMERASPADESRLWVVIKNGSTKVRMFCKQGWGYSLIPDDLSNPPFIRAWTSVHGCGDDEHDPFWLLLPGESRVDSVVVETPPTHNYDVDVSVDIDEIPLGSAKVAAHRTLEWKGRLSDAITRFDRLKVGRLR